MAGRSDAAVIFDVDGPLLELTAAEEDAYFSPFRDLHGITQFNRDWDSYRVRNDIEIYREIFEARLARIPDDGDIAALSRHYFATLEDVIASGSAQVVEIPGARQLLETLDRHDGLALGMATANFRVAARIRLAQAGMWEFVKGYPGAADDGGAKRDVLARVIANLGLPADRIVFLGDNLNDLDAANATGVHFIGFHVDAPRRARLAHAGAGVTCGDHTQSLALIRDFLALS